MHAKTLTAVSLLLFGLSACRPAAQDSTPVTSSSGRNLGTLSSSLTGTRGPLTGVDSNSKFLIYYENDFSTEIMTKMKTFDIVVLNPNQSNCTPRVVKELQDAGVKYVFGYISIGEDFPGYNPDGTRESLIPHTGTGPVYKDETTGAMVHGNDGVASFYVDAEHISGSNPVAYSHDGQADTNSKFGGYYIHPNSDWRWVINVMRIGGNPGVFMDRKYKAGLQQIADNRSANLDAKTENFGFDGFFLDTIDTAGPYTSKGWYPWAAEEMKNTLEFISQAYPTKAILGNRGLFYYQPGVYNTTFDVRPIDFSIRPYVNAVLFESYKLDSSDNPGISAFYEDNRYNNAPKLMAEANRADGFTLMGIDYMVNRGESLYLDVLQETVQENGWIQYLSTNGDINTVETFTADRLPMVDSTPPTWMHTGTTTAANPRVGIQELLRGDNPGEVKIRWDGAKDQSWPIKYNIYVATSPDFSDQVKHGAVAFETTKEWLKNPADHAANEYVLSGLGSQTYYVRVRAEDSSVGNLEESNTQTLSIDMSSSAPISNPIPLNSITYDGQLTEWATLTGFARDPDDIPGTEVQTDWLQVWMAHDANQLYFAYENDGLIQINWGYIVYMDTDTNASTGFRGGAGEYPIGVDYLINGYELWRYTGSGINWSWEKVANLGYVWSGPNGEMFMPRHWMGNPSAINLFFVGNNSVYGGSEFDYYPDGALTNGAFFQYQLD